uniref:Uncharacterized protein n=1 Tax=Calidris pygmaea TaxID=425635 RepID=A0A8C3JNC7_9CHAR
MASAKLLCTLPFKNVIFKIWGLRDSAKTLTISLTFKSSTHQFWFLLAQCIQCCISHDVSHEESVSACMRLPAVFTASLGKIFQCGVGWLV